MTTETTTSGVDVDAIRKEWLRQCGLCDAGLLTECTCPKGDVRALISTLCDRVDELTAEREHMELNPTGTAEWLKNRVNELTAELDRARADERNTIAADIERMDHDLGDDGWRWLQDKAENAGYPRDAVRRRRTRLDFTTATIEMAYQYGYRQAAKVARGEVAR